LCASLRRTCSINEQRSYLRPPLCATAPIHQASTMKVNLGSVEETLLVPMWGRATISREYPSLLNDAKAVELVGQIDYDFSTLDKTLHHGTNLLHAARSKQIDDKIRVYITQHPKASVIDLGVALDTAFSASTMDRCAGTTSTLLRS
jgi:hypothetical protein